MPATYLTSDLAALFNSADFASSATYGSATISVLFDDEYAGYNTETGVVETSGPRAFCRTSDLSAVSHSSTLVVNSITYRVIGIKPDGTGVTELTLSRD